MEGDVELVRRGGPATRPRLDSGAVTCQGTRGPADRDRLARAPAGDLEDEELEIMQAREDAETVLAGITARVEEATAGARRGRSPRGTPPRRRSTRRRADDDRGARGVGALAARRSARSCMKASARPPVGSARPRSTAGAARAAISSSAGRDPRGPRRGARRWCCATRIAAASWSARPSPGSDAAGRLRDRGRRWSRGNPGPAGYGAVVTRPRHRGGARRACRGHRPRDQQRRRIPRPDRRARPRLRCGARRASVEVRMDSKLVVEQMSGRWKVKHPDMIPLAREAADLVRQLPPVRFTWIPRERNKHADRLANEAMDAQAAGRAWEGETEASLPRADGRLSPRPSAAADAVLREPLAAPRPAARRPGWTAAGPRRPRRCCCATARPRLSVEKRFQRPRRPPAHRRRAARRPPAAAGRARPARRRASRDRHLAAAPGAARPPRPSRRPIGVDRCVEDRAASRPTSATGRA